MPAFEREEIEPVLSKIKAGYEHKVQDLRDLIPTGGRILNLGCDSGYESIALMWFLDASVVIGVDKDISKTEYMACKLKRDFDNCVEAKNYEWVTADDRKWLHTDVPKFLHKGYFPSFVMLDIALEDDFKSKLSEGHFHLAYCSSVLDKVHKDHSRVGVRSTIESVNSVLIPGGWFIYKRRQTRVVVPNVGAD